MGKRVAILQSSYIPWKGYFDLIRSVDEFVLYDDAQFTRRDWRNRNVIPTKEGPVWLTIPVAQKGNYHAPIRDIEIPDRAWAGRHWKTIENVYRRAPGFGTHGGALEKAFAEAGDERRLSAVNHVLLRRLGALLGIATPLTWSMDYRPEGDRNAKLLDVCRKAGATTYVSGPAARAYLDVGLFEAAGVAVEYFDYSGYPAYPPLWPPFDHHVSVVDLLLCTGSDAPRHLDRSPS